MTIVERIDRIRDWTQETVCSKVQLKRPNDNAVDKNYEYTLVNPAAFSLYNPGRDRLPPKVTAPISSVCVQMMEGDSNLLYRAGRLQIRYVFAAWNPGTHGPDELGASDSLNVRFVKSGQDMPFTPPAANPIQPSENFIRNGDGWRDVWNFVDAAIRELESTDVLNGLRIVREVPIRFGPVTEQDAIVDFYPYWYAWVSFTVESGIARNNMTHNKLL